MGEEGVPADQKMTSMGKLQELRVIIYDCDGVLIDSREGNQAFYHHILAHFALSPLTPEQWRQVAPLTAPAGLTRLLQGTPWLAAAQDYQQTVDNAPFLPLLEVEPHLKETLTLLRPYYRTAVATNRGKSLMPVLRHFSLEDFFDLVISSLDVREPKPHPEGIVKILEHFRPCRTRPATSGTPTWTGRWPPRPESSLGPIRTPRCQPASTSKTTWTCGAC